jgi:hypothetical protein
MELKTVRVEKPADVNFILGQSHFIKTVEDLHETAVSSAPGIKFGLAFCEASGACLVRWSGNDDEMIGLARSNAEAIGAGRVSDQPAQCGEGAARSVSDILRDREQRRGRRGGDRSRARNPRRHRRGTAEGNRGSAGPRLEARFSQKDRV